MSRTLYLFLIALTLAWPAGLMLEPALVDEDAAFQVTLFLVAINALAALRVLTYQRRVLITLNCLQPVLFGLLSYQLHVVFGPDHYRVRHEPRLHDWIEFIAAHILRAADFLDGLDEYGITLQTIRHNSVSSALILVCMHLVVDVFLLGLLLNAVRRWWGQPSYRETLLARERREFAWGLVTLLLFIVFAVGQGLTARDWLLWPVENVLRLVDIGDMFQLFRWKLHGVESNPWTRAAAIGFRFASGVWIAKKLLLLRATVFATWGLSVDELRNLLDDHDPRLRGGAARGLGRSGPHAVPSLDELVHLVSKDPDVNVRRHAAWALGRIGPSVANAEELAEAIEALARAVFDERRELRLEASRALGRLGSKAWPALGSLAWLLKVSTDDRRTLKVVRQAKRRIERDWRRSRKWALERR